MDKPTKPTVSFPSSFGGIKTEFNSSLIASGYKEAVPEVVAGDNLNFLLDSLGKLVNYNKIITDFINDCPIGKLVSVDSNNKLVYVDVASQVNADWEATEGAAEILHKPTNLADKDLSNLTALAGEVITNANMPDYSAMVTKAWDTDHTAECDGWLFYIVACTSALKTANFTLNGTLYSLAYQPSATQITWSGWIPIAEGATYKFSGGLTTNSAVLFYPARGV